MFEKLRGAMAARKRFLASRKHPMQSETWAGQKPAI
jgi:hypothetical protein